MILLSVKLGKHLVILSTSCIVILFAMQAYCAETKAAFFNKGSVLLVDTIGTIIPFDKETVLSITVKQSNKAESTNVQSIVDFATLLYDAFTQKIGRLNVAIVAQGKTTKNKTVVNFNKKYAGKKLLEAIPISVDFLYDTATDIVCSAIFSYKAKHYMVRIKRYAENGKRAAAKESSPFPLEILKVRSVSL